MPSAKSRAQFIQNYLRTDIGEMTSMPLPLATFHSRTRPGPARVRRWAAKAERAIRHEIVLTDPHRTQ